MNPQEKAIETLKIKGVLEALTEKYGYARVFGVLESLK